jgi:hypothetical protein
MEETEVVRVEKGWKRGEVWKYCCKPERNRIKTV